MAQEGRRVQEARFSETQVRNMFQAFADDIMDVESDEESEAPVEAGEEAKAAKKAKTDTAKRQKITGGIVKVVAKIGKF